ncbi:MAG: GDP-mannose 4,6-dehydratase, partial [Proteobacteria bacterium]|nr:GDP-mannose 4,6-dehydratase [Pseudomonadota bacterium]
MGLKAAFWRGRRVLLTGHTGFKGAWLALWLERLGARLTGFALEADGDPNLFRLLAPWPRLDSIIGDVRDADAVARAVERADPEIAFHMAAQSLVRRGFREPVATLATNVVGTANLLEALRACEGLRAVVVVTSDKCYDD